MTAASCPWRIEERVDDYSVVEPQPQRHGENDSERDDALQSRGNRFLDLAGHLQIAPHHEVDCRERDDCRLKRRRHPRRLIAYVGREKRVEPSAEFREETHSRAPDSGSR
jgi:hypothetical protein